MLQRLDNDQQVWLGSDPATPFTSTSMVTAAVSGIAPGPARLTMFVNGIPSASSVVTVTSAANAGVATTSTVTVSPNPALAGQTVTLTATVTGDAPTGLVQFFDVGTPLGAAVPLTSGQATLQTNGLAVGSHRLSASYLGDANNYGSVSSTVNVSVQASLVSQTITFAAVANQSTNAFPVSFTLTAPTASSGLTVGVSSLTGSVCLVSGSTVTLLTVGTCTLQATQMGDNTYAAATPVSQSFGVIVAPTNSTGDVPLPPWAYVLLSLGLLAAMRWQRRPA
jgi:hypothetical protein